LETAFYPLVAPLLEKAWRLSRPLRLVSVKLSGVDDGPVQMDIFGGTDSKRRRLAGVMDQLNAQGEGLNLVRAHQLKEGDAIRRQKAREQRNQ
jgi:DNA polymerase-4